METIDTCLENIDLDKHDALKKIFCLSEYVNIGGQDK